MEEMKVESSEKISTESSDEDAIFFRFFSSIRSKAIEVTSLINNALIPKKMLKDECKNFSLESDEMFYSKSLSLFFVIATIELHKQEHSGEISDFLGMTFVDIIDNILGYSNHFASRMNIDIKGLDIKRRICTVAIEYINKYLESNARETDIKQEIPNN